MPVKMKYPAGHCMMSFTIRQMTQEDWGQASVIYAEGIATGNSTFETGVPSYDQWISRHLTGFSIVACDGGAVLGWGSLSPYSSRRVYAGVAEASVYVGRQYRGRGVGSALLGSLIELSESRGLWTLQAGIFPENIASVAMCKSLGFLEVGVRKRLGQLGGVWRDVLLLERRSERVGIDRKPGR
jgi:L-amino acid N-acyltransferase YncA